MSGSTYDAGLISQQPVTAQGSLVATKVHPPQGRRRLVPRDGLVDRLVAGVDGRLTVVTAPAGWGKTTLLLEWHRRSSPERAFAWLSLDADDSDPTRFWAYLVHSLAEVDPAAVAPVLPLLDRIRVDLRRAVLPALLNQLQTAFRRSVVLVLDDYHAVTSPEIDQLLAYFVDHAPPTVHVAIVSRTAPSLPIPRFRARGEVTEVRADDLRFSRAETSTLLRDLLGLPMTAQEVLTLQERTEGWVAALQLAALTVRTRGGAAGIDAFSGEHEHLVEYLGAEVLDALDPPLRTFVLETSVLDRMSAPLCDAVTGRDDAEAMLREVESRNLFLVSLDDRRQWFRYHHLFGETLRAKLAGTAPDRPAALHLRAAQWYDAAGSGPEAIRHAFASGDLDAAHDLVNRHWNEHYNLGRLATVTSWLAALGEARTRRDPWLSAARVLIWADQGRLDELDAWLDSGHETAVDSYFYAVLRALHRFKCGDLGSAHRELEHAAATRIDTEPFWPTVEHCLRGAVGYWYGDSAAARAALSTAGLLARSNGNVAGLTYSLGYLALLAVDEQDATEADRVLAQTQLLVAQGTDLGSHFVGTLPLLAQGRLTSARGDRPAALALLQRSVAVARSGAGRLELLAALVGLAREQATQGERADSAALLREAAAVLKRCPDPGRGVALLADQPRVPKPRLADSGDALTAREAAVLQLLPTPMSLREIADSLFVSHNTAKTHLRAVYRKLAATTREEAVERARVARLL